MSGDPWPWNINAPHFPYYLMPPPMPCNHCWCEEAGYPADHAKCCMCRSVMHYRFLPPGVRAAEPTAGATS